MRIQRKQVFDGAHRRPLKSRKDEADNGRHPHLAWNYWMAVGRGQPLQLVRVALHQDLRDPFAIGLEGHRRLQHAIEIA